MNSEINEKKVDEKYLQVIIDLFALIHLDSIVEDIPFDVQADIKLTAKVLLLNSNMKESNISLKDCINYVLSKYKDKCQEYTDSIAS